MRSARRVFLLSYGGFAMKHLVMIDDSLETELDLELERESLFLRDSHRQLDSQLLDSSPHDVAVDSTEEDLLHSDVVGASECPSGVEVAPQSALVGAVAKAKPSPQSSSSGQSEFSDAANFNSDVVIGHALNSLEPERIEQFWENGFWSNIFTNDNPVNSMFPKGLKRPLPCYEPQTDDDIDHEPKGVAPEAQEKFKGCHFATVVKSGLQYVHGGMSVKRSGKRQFADGTLW